MYRLPLNIITICLLSMGCVGTDFITAPAPTVPARVEIDPVNTAIAVGDMKSYQASYFDTLGQVVSSPVFQWTSTNPSIATIDNNGVAVGLQTGQTNIMAMIDGIVSDAGLLTVVMDTISQVATVTVTPDEAEITDGETILFSAAAMSLNGMPLTGRTFTWRSTDPSVATINSAGLATGISTGQTDIIATADGIDSSPARLTIQSLLRQRIGGFIPKRPQSYTVEGTAVFEELIPGSRVILNLRDDFLVSNGPGIEMILSTTNTVNSGSISLGRVKQLSGAHSYDVPGEVRIDDFNWVIIHCVPFNVSFGCAELVGP